MGRRYQRGRLAAYREPRDLWVGAYRGPDALYLCPLPTLVIRVGTHMAAGTLTDQLSDTLTAQGTRARAWLSWARNRTTRTELGLWAGRHLPGPVSYGAFIAEVAYATTRPPLSAVPVPEVPLDDLLRAVSGRHDQTRAEVPA